MRVFWRGWFVDPNSFVVSFDHIFTGDSQKDIDYQIGVFIRSKALRGFRFEHDRQEVQDVSQAYENQTW